MTSTLPPLVQAFSGAIGSAAANTATYPLDLVTTRLQTSRSRKIRGIPGAIRILTQIVRKHGVAALYDGLDTDTGATLLSNFFYFYFYSFLRSLSARRAASKPASTGSSRSSQTQQTLLSLPTELAMGFIAGVASRAISMPLNLITVRMQTEREEEDEDEDTEKADLPIGGERKTGILAVVKRIYAEDGLAGFWRGFETTVLLSLNPALTLCLFQLFRRVFLRGRDSATPAPGQAFVGAAMSNSVAVSILYPLILAKTRLQAARASGSGSDVTMWGV